MKPVVIYTDGACRGNPGPGGWGAVLRYNGSERRLHGGDAATTNNRMELMAAIQALETLKEPCKVTLHTDSFSSMRQKRRRPSMHSMVNSVDLRMVTNRHRAASLAAISSPSSIHSSIAQTP